MKTAPAAEQRLRVGAVFASVQDANHGHLRHAFRRLLPGGLEAQQLTVTSTIEAIDTSAGTLTLKGADGETFTTKVRDPAKLKLVCVGDLVELTYTEAIAVSVEPAPK